MAYDNQIKNLMLRAYQRVEKKRSLARRQHMQKRLDFYDGDQIDYLDHELLEQFKKPDRLKLQKEIFNLTKAIIDEEAVIYSKPPKREVVDGTNADKELLNSIIKEGQLDIVLDTVNKMTKLCKVVLVRPVVRQREKIEFDIITPNVFDVMQNMSNPTVADAIIYSRIFDDSLLLPQMLEANDVYTRGKEPTKKKVESISREELGKLIYYYWDLNRHFAFSGKDEVIKIGGNEKGINPYKALPFVVFRDNYPKDRFFDMSGRELILANEIINIKLTELNYLTKMQAFSQPVRKGAPKGTNFDLDPSMCIDIPADDEQSKGADFYFVTPEARITELSSDIEKKLQRICMQHKLNPEMFRLSGERSSGFSIQMQNFQLGKQINRDKPYYRAYERQLFEMIKIVWNYENTKQFSKNCKLKIDFEDVGEPMNTTEKDQHNLILHQNGIQSRAEWLLSENPDLGTIEEAQKKIDEIDAMEKNRIKTPEEIAAEKKRLLGEEE